MTETHTLVLDAPTETPGPDARAVLRTVLWAPIQART